MNKDPQIIISPSGEYTIIENPIGVLAKELFIKSYRSGEYLTEKTESSTISTIKNSIEVAKLFYKLLDETKND